MRAQVKPRLWRLRRYFLCTTLCVACQGAGPASQEGTRPPSPAGRTTPELERELADLRSARAGSHVRTGQLDAVVLDLSARHAEQGPEALSAFHDALLRDAAGEQERAELRRLVVTYHRLRGTYTAWVNGLSERRRAGRADEPMLRLLAAALDPRPAAPPKTSSNAATAMAPTATVRAEHTGAPGSVFPALPRAELVELLATYQQLHLVTPGDDAVRASIHAVRDRLAMTE